MTLAPKHKIHGHTLEQEIAYDTHELSQDAVGLWTLVDAAQIDFKLTGSDLDKYLIKSFTELGKAGGRPAKGGAGSKYYWDEQKQFGSDPHEVASRLLEEVKLSKYKIEPCSGIWFVSEPRLSSLK
jgi:hypothetical protein